MRFVFGILIVITCVQLHAQRGIISIASEPGTVIGCTVSLYPEEGVKQYGQGDTIHLPQESSWQIYDQYGNLVRKGVSVGIAVRGLQAGGYYLLYDNVTMQIAVFNEEHRGKPGK